MSNKKSLKIEPIITIAAFLFAIFGIAKIATVSSSSEEYDYKIQPVRNKTLDVGIKSDDVFYTNNISIDKKTGALTFIDEKTGRTINMKHWVLTVQDEND